MHEILDHIIGADRFIPHIDEDMTFALADSGHLARYGDYHILTTHHLAIPIIDNDRIMEKLYQETMEMYDERGVGQIVPRVRMTTPVQDILEDAIEKAQRHEKLATPRDVLRALLLADSREHPDVSIFHSINEDPSELLEKLDRAPIPLPASRVRRISNNRQIPKL